MTLQEIRFPFLYDYDVLAWSVLCGDISLGEFFATPSDVVVSSIHKSKKFEVSDESILKSRFSRFRLCRKESGRQNESAEYESVLDKKIRLRV